jgi:DNA polymerase I-like protein with 3'-5' exonuclease and polymerase domains
VCEVVPLIKLFKEGHPIFGTDIHSLTATNMFRIIKNDPDWACDKVRDKKERNIAKAMLFKILYGGSPYTIAQDLGTTLEEGELFFNAFFDANEGLKENFEETKAHATKNGWITLDQFTKKRYYFAGFEEMQELYKKACSYYPEEYKKLSKLERELYKAKLKVEHPELSEFWKQWSILKGKLERASLNYRIQGSGATMTKIAALLIDEDNLSLDHGLLLMVHDELVEEYSKEKKLEEISKRTVSEMIKAGSYICKKVPMDAETAIGDYWIH